MCLRFQFCTHQRVCVLHFLKKSQNSLYPIPQVIWDLYKLKEVLIGGESEFLLYFPAKITRHIPPTLQVSIDLYKGKDL